MAIPTKSLYDSCKREFGSGVNTTRFDAAFLDAVNDTLDELSLSADLATRLTHLTDNEGSIDLDKQYRWLVLAGVRFRLIREIPPADPRVVRVLYDDTAGEWERAKAAYVVAEDNDNQATDSNDVWGLGYLG